MLIALPREVHFPHMITETVCSTSSTRATGPNPSAFVHNQHPAASCSLVSSPFSSPVPELVQVLKERVPAPWLDEDRKEQGPPSQSSVQGPPQQLHCPLLSSDPSKQPADGSDNECYKAMHNLAQRSASCLLGTVLRANCVTPFDVVGPGSAPGGASVTSSIVTPGMLQCAPPHGVRAVCGKRAKMEDTFSVQTNFADVTMSNIDIEFANKLPARLASQVGDQLDPQASPPNSLPLSPSTAVPSLSSSDHEASVGGSCTSDASACSDTLHFFGVYDGHGGVEAAQHCANRLHHHLSSALAHVAAGSSAAVHTQDVVCVQGANGLQCSAEWKFCSSSNSHVESQQAGEQRNAKLERHVAAAAAAATAGCSGFQNLDESEATSTDTSPFQPQGSHASLLDVASTDCDSSSSGSGSIDAASANSRASTDSACVSSALEAALKSAFIRTDEEFAADGSSAMVGSTAVVALVGTRKMWIANCGDSRAVLCRGGKAYQVTDDHKPEREDEAERVEKAGGQVLYWNGHRVMGVLAMSRAIGDHGLRPYVIPEPEITVLQRVTEDEFLLLASDGLWDVMTNQEAIQLATRCLARSSDRGATREAAVRVAATVLTRAAVDRGSKDNVTVVIIDLKSQHPTSSDSKQPGNSTTSTTNSVCEKACSSTGSPANSNNKQLDEVQSNRQKEQGQAGSTAPQKPRLMHQKTLVRINRDYLVPQDSDSPASSPFACNATS